MFKKNALLFLMLMMSFFVVNEARAVPSFARQTGMPCSSCHTVFPELTSFGRQFKLNGYTLTGMKQIESSKAENNLKINDTLPMSVMLQAGFTHVNKADPSVQNDDIQLPQQLSLFLAGEISSEVGSFIQLTYDQESDKLNWDNTDIRFATQVDDNTFGVTLNNSPTVQDVWNSTPAWGYPFSGSGSAPGVSASGAGLLDMFAQDSAGIGGYAMWNGNIYTELTLYRSAHLGQAQPDITSVNTINGVAPYWRLAWQNNLSNGDYLMLGTYGMKASVYPGDGATTGISGPTDQYTDAALDAQYEHMLASNLVSVHFNYQNENQTLDATSAGNSPVVKTTKLDGTYHWGNEATATLAYWTTKADSDYTAAYGGIGDNNGYIAQASYLPWQNTKLTAQYTAYSKFDGLPSGAKAADNNTLFLQAWLMW